jgi:hypothetical protein
MNCNSILAKNLPAIKLDFDKYPSIVNYKQYIRPSVTLPKPNPPSLEFD